DPGVMPGGLVPVVAVPLKKQVDGEDPGPLAGDPGGEPPGAIAAGRPSSDPGEGEPGRVSSAGRGVRAFLHLAGWRARVWRRRARWPGLGRRSWSGTTTSSGSPPTRRPGPGPATGPPAPAPGSHPAGPPGPAG